MLYPSDTVLARFTRDLTEAARRGALDPVRCRAEEIARVIDILLRQGKNNPVLVGPAGVGKTAIAEGLAQRIADGSAPLSLRNVRILALDHVSLLAGTMFRGQYEERIRGLVEEATAAENVILFVDELHNLIGQGTAMGAAMDAANMLKPALVRGDFRVIGATTDGEYARWIQGDPALERRFQKITVRELDADQTLEILRARKQGLERHHGVVVSDDALLAAVRLTDLFVTDRMRPDRAIDALDEACAHLHAVAAYPAAVESLLAARRSLLRAPRRESSVGGEPAPAAADGLDEDPFDRLARDGFAALERFGAELEAVFAGVDARPARRPATGDRPAPDDLPTASSASTRSLPEIEAELERALMEAGIVVRGHDIARVVSVMSGRRVEWSS